MPRHIAWFNEAPVEPDPLGGLRSPDARVRRRCLLPARELERLGILCSVFGNLRDADPKAVCDKLKKLEVDLIVVGQITDPSLITLAKAARRIGCDIVLDCDFDDQIAPDFAALTILADHLVAATPHTALLLAKANLAATVIPDCDECGDEHAPGAIASLWLNCFRALGMHLPAVANTNVPLMDNG